MPSFGRQVSHGFSLKLKNLGGQGFKGLGFRRSAITCLEQLQNPGQSMSKLAEACSVAKLGKWTTKGKHKVQSKPS